VHLILRPNHQPWRLRSLAADVRRHEAALEDRGRWNGLYVLSSPTGCSI